MRQRILRWFWIVLGWALLIAGTVFWVLPIPGITLAIVAGLLILSAEYTWAYRLLEKLLTRFPRLRAGADSLRKRMRSERSDN